MFFRLEPHEYEFDENKHSKYVGNGETVVIWPPPSSLDQSHGRESVVTPKNLADPDRKSEYERQKRLELTAIKQKRQRDQEVFAKQVYATKVQQQRISQSQIYSPENFEGAEIDSPDQDRQLGYSGPGQDGGVGYRGGPGQPGQSYQRGQPNHTNHLGQTGQYNQPGYSSHSNQPGVPNQLGQSGHLYQPSQLGQDYDGPNQNVRIFETRPISGLSQYSGQAPSWRRTYIVEDQEIAAKNTILNSNQILEQEQYEIDLLHRRDTFVEKPIPSIEINRVGKVWQPPPDEPYVWPSAKNNFSEHKWVPVVGTPEFKRETKNFTPTPSPPHSPIKGRGKAFFI